MWTGALLTIDSTVATPVLTTPLALGADIVLHSATKYLDGHSDVIAGAMVYARMHDTYDRAARFRQSFGAVLGAFEASMLLRNLRTLHIRVRRQSELAMAIAARFDEHPAINGVLYSGLVSHPGYVIAARQMKGGFGGMLSMQIQVARQLRSPAPVECRSGSGPRRWVAWKVLLSTVQV